MTFLPIVGRELRVAARRRVVYWSRLLVGLGAVCLAAVIFVLSLGQPPSKSSSYIFQGLSWLCLIYALAGGRRSTADCLSEEKREGTLGLLFLTDLKGYDVVLGKLTATSLAGFYGLVAVVPVLAVPLLMGGITNGEFWRTVLVLVNTCLLSLAIGILASVLSWDYRQAMGLNLLLLLLVCAGGPACAGLMAFFASTRPALPPELFFYTCPVYSLLASSDLQYRISWQNYWLSVVATQAMIWLVLALASWLAPRSWREQPVGIAGRSGGSGRSVRSVGSGGSVRVGERMRRLRRVCLYGSAAGQLAFRRSLLPRNAFYWLAARARLKPAHVWTFLGLVACWWFVGWIASGSMWFDESVAVVTGLMLNVTFKIWVAVESGQHLAEEQKSGAMELLLSSPLDGPDIVRGQLLALRRQFLGPWLVVMGLAWLWQFYQHSWSVETVLLWRYAMLMLAADLLALPWVAMRQALTAKNPNQAALQTIFKILLLPYLLGVLVLVVLQLWYWLVEGTGWPSDWRFNARLWLGLGLGVDLYFGLRAWWQLRARFRPLALHRFASGPEALAPPPQLEVPEAKAPPSSARLSPIWNRPARWRPWQRKLAFIGLVLVGLALTFAVLEWRSRPSYPPSVVVSLTQSNNSLVISPGPPAGMLLLLPDGSLWQWGRRPWQLGLNSESSSGRPERVGTNSDWAQIIAAPGYWVGLRRDGTLWQWTSRTLGLSVLPEPVGTNDNWASVAAGPNGPVALNREGTLWTWGGGPTVRYGLAGTRTNPAVRSGGKMAMGPSPPAAASTRRLIQVGAEHEWTAIASQPGCAFGLQTNGTLWVWGHLFYSVPFGVPPSLLSQPTQVCSDTNWSGLSSGLRVWASMRDGQVWEPSFRPPNAAAPAAAVARLVASNAAPHRLAVAYGAGASLYEVRPDGTLWQQSYPLGGLPPGALSNEPWRRVGKRSDWLSVNSAGGTAVGLTADGTLWTWGVDPSGETKLDLWSRLKLVPARLRVISAAAGGSLAGLRAMSFQKEPRPLMRLVYGQAEKP